MNWNNILVKFFIIGFGGLGNEMNKCVSLGIVFIIVTLPNTVSFLRDQSFITFWICLILESKLYISISSKFRVKLIPSNMN